MASIPALFVSTVVILVAAALIVFGTIGARRGGIARGLGLMAISVGAITLGLLGSAYIITGFFLPLFVLIGLFGLLGFAVWIAALADCLQNETDERNNRLIWVIIIVVGQLIGALLYWLWWRPKRRTQTKA